MIIQAAVAFVATLFFTIIFLVPRRLFWVCAAGGTLGWVVYSARLLRAAPPPFACFAATLVLVIYSRAAGVVFRCPVSIIITTGIFPLVPGAAIYHTAYSLIMGQTVLAGQKAMETLATAGVISLGMLFGYALPQRLFQSFSKMKSG
jgi:uncharacterized membrane protein YjjB (DUF3815 family)